MCNPKLRTKIKHNAYVIVTDRCSTEEELSDTPEGWQYDGQEDVSIEVVGHVVEALESQPRTTRHAQGPLRLT